MSIRIRIDGGTAVLSAATAPDAAAPFSIALVEARGALLSWPVPPRRFPDALVHSPVEAQAWLADVYGPLIAAAAQEGRPAELSLPADAERVDAVRSLALLTWARSWWPAGHRVPRRDPDALAAEIVLATHAVDDLLDDEEATARALADAVAVPGALGDALADLAEDHGLALVSAAPSRADWALAAGGVDAHVDGVEIAHGTAQIRWADVPAQTLAADADARWSLRHIGGQARLIVEADAVEGSRVPDLRARFGVEELGIDATLVLTRDVFSGAVDVPASLALLPLDQRTLWVRDTALAAHPGPAESDEQRAAVIAYAEGTRP